MKTFKLIKYWIFDLDNTLYSGETRVFDQVEKKMSQYVSDKLNINIDEAKKIQKFQKIPKSALPRTHENPGTPSPSLALECKCAVGAKIFRRIYLNPSSRFRKRMSYT